MGSENTTISSICVSSIGSLVTGGRRMPYSVCSSIFEIGRCRSQRDNQPIHLGSRRRVMIA